jgi:hypothetical protein
MPTNKLLISEVTYARTKNVTVKRKLDASPPLIGLDGKVVDADTRNPMNEISLKGEGDIDAALVTGASLTTSLVTGGKTLIHSVETSEHNEGKYNDWSVEALNGPAA